MAAPPPVAPLVKVGELPPDGRLVPIYINYAPGHSYLSTNNGGDCTILPIGENKGIQEYVLLDSGHEGAYEHILAFYDEIQGPNKKIVGIILSHFDSDHVEGLEKIITISKSVEREDATNKPKCIGLLSHIQWIATGSISKSTRTPAVNTFLSYFNLNQDSLKVDDEASQEVFKRTRGKILTRRFTDPIKDKNNTFSEQMVFSLWNQAGNTTYSVTKNKKTTDVIFDHAGFKQKMKEPGFQDEIRKSADLVNNPSLKKKKKNLGAFKTQLPESGNEKIHQLLGSRKTEDAEDHSKDNLSSLITLYLGDHFVFFTGDSVERIVFNETLFLPRSKEDYDEVLESVVLNEQSSDQPKSKEQQIYEQLFSLQVIKDCLSEKDEDKKKNIVGQLKKFSHSPVDFFQLPHHGSIKNMFPFYFDLEFLKKNNNQIITELNTAIAAIPLTDPTGAQRDKAVIKQDIQALIPEYIKKIVKGRIKETCKNNAELSKFFTEDEISDLVDEGIGPDRVYDVVTSDKFSKLTEFLAEYLHHKGDRYHVSGGGTKLHPTHALFDTLRPLKEKKEQRQIEGEQPQTKGEPPQTEGEPPQTKGEPPQTKGEPPQTEGEPPQTKGEPPQTEGGITSQIDDLNGKLSELLVGEKEKLDDKKINETKIINGETVSDNQAGISKQNPHPLNKEQKLQKSFFFSGVQSLNSQKKPLEDYTKLEKEGIIHTLYTDRANHHFAHIDLDAQ